jgi:hypothetical protein
MPNNLFVDDPTWVDKRCIDTVYITPTKILTPIRSYFGGQIPLDPATEASNPTDAVQFFILEDDGLKLPWNQPTFVNPPYGSGIKDWCKKIHDEAARGTTIIALMPCGARFSTKYWQNYILSEKLQAICFVRGRVSFLRPDGTPAKQNPYDSQILGYNVDVDKFVKTIGPLGKVLRVTQ